MARSRPATRTKRTRWRDGPTSSGTSSTSGLAQSRSGFAHGSAISAGSGLRNVTCGAITDIETKCSPLPYDEGERRRLHAQPIEGN